MPYARSEAHLTELLERICEKMKEYGEKADPTTQRKSYVRVISHDGTKLDLSGVKIDGDVASSLKFAVRVGVAAGLGAPRVLLVTPRVVRLQCESIAEEYEDELIEFLSHEADNVKDRLCSKRTGEGGGGEGPSAIPPGTAVRTGGASNHLRELPLGMASDCPLQGLSWGCLLSPPVVFGSPGSAS